jgi:hypothetical protein
MQWQQPEEKKIPNWLGFLIAAAVFGGIAYSVIWYTSRDDRGTAKKASAETAAPKSIGTHTYAKSLEVAGFRITQPGKNKVNVQFLVINHGNYEMSDLGGTITLRAKGLGPEAPPAVVFKFKVSSVPPFGAKEVEVNEVIEILKPNDMPDWQFYVPEVEITSPVE